MPPILEAMDLTLSYEGRTISQNLQLQIEAGTFTVIIGPNACGKSTLLKALARLLKPQKGQVNLQGKDITAYTTIDVARRLGLLPQNPIAPENITVMDLVARGRYPHQTWLKRWTTLDEATVLAAMEATGILQFAERTVDTLSGGQRQRVWIAMILAQQTPILLLDEPTTYLDISYQIELLELLHGLNKAQGYTLVVVLHDINQAFRYADQIIAMKDGKILAYGPPKNVVTPQLIETVFGLPCMIIDDPVSHTPLVIPCGKAHY